MPISSFFHQELIGKYDSQSYGNIYKNMTYASHSCSHNLSTSY
ncbi:Uncharacterised protein [Serratia fonticola]|nr:Uncharacterised protein [Serratia fonticola]